MAHVVASLKKTASKPARPSSFSAAGDDPMIQSLLGTTAEDPSIQQVLSDLRSAGKVTINALQERLRVAEAERAQLEEQLASVQTSVPADLVATISADHRRLVMRLQGALSEQADRDRTRKMLAEMLGPVTTGKNAEVDADIKKPAERLLAAACGGSSLEVVAGACNVSRRRLAL